jgi:hypothetical protein
LFLIRILLHVSLKNRMKMIQLGPPVRVVGALIAGGAIAFLPYAVRNLSESGIVGLLKLGITYLGLPGVVVSIVLAGNVHLGSLWIINAANMVFYFGLTYYLLTLCAKPRIRLSA